MEWYYYLIFVVLGLIACWLVIGIRTRRGIKEKKAEARRAAKKSKSGKKKKPR